MVCTKSEFYCLTIGAFEHCKKPFVCQPIFSRLRVAIDGCRPIRWNYFHQYCIKCCKNVAVGLIGYFKLDKRSVSSRCESKGLWASGAGIGNAIRFQGVWTVSVLPAISLQIKSYEEDRPAESTRLRAGYGKTTVRDQFTGQILVMMRIFIFLSMRKQEYMKIQSEWR